MASSTPRVFRRSGDGLEFDRVAFFSDAIYARVAHHQFVARLDAIDARFRG